MTGESNHEMNQCIDTFQQEAEDILSDIEEIVLDIEQHPGDPDGIHRLFRAVHTLKGSGAMFGYDNLAALAHHVETLLDDVRKGRIGVSEALINLVLAARDGMKAMLCGGKADGHGLSDYEEIIAALKNLAADASDPAEASAGDAEKDLTARPSQSRERVFAIRFQPNRDIRSSGTDPSLLLKELGELGQCTIAADLDDLPPLDGLDPEVCYFRWDILLRTRQETDAVKDVFIFVEEESIVDIQAVEGSDKKMPSEPDTPLPRGNRLPEKRKKSVKGEPGGPFGPGICSRKTAPARPQDRTEAGGDRGRKSGLFSENLRVPSEKLDTLINLVGELLINQARLNRAAATVPNPELDDPLLVLERLSADLRDCALDMRMLPIGTLFDRFRRLVRDLSNQLGKEIGLVTLGGDTEMDKTVVERLFDPLVHLIRNCIDHGIQSPGERDAAGKPRKGTIRLNATHKESRVEIIISDDGCGVDTDAVHAKAVESGLLSGEEDLTESEITDLIFVPGFSTTEKVTALSGRGVGMDVVKRTVGDLSGTIHIDSERGVGTIIRLSLPLTLAIIEGLQVKAAGRDFVLPLEQVEECYEIKRADLEKTRGRNVVPVRGELIPFIRINRTLRLSETELPAEQLVIARIGKFRAGLVVDEVLGKLQTVIKPLGCIYREAEGISGATILGDGRVALVVDIPGLVECAKREAETAAISV